VFALRTLPAYIHYFVAVPETRALFDGDWHG